MSNHLTQGTRDLGFGMAGKCINGKHVCWIAAELQLSGKILGENRAIPYINPRFTTQNIGMTLVEPVVLKQLIGLVIVNFDTPSGL